METTIWLASWLSEMDPAARGGLAASLLLMSWRAAGWLLLPRPAREEAVLPSRAWAGLAGTLWVLSWGLWPAAALYRRVTAKAPPAPCADPVPFADEVAAMLEEIESNPKAAVAFVNGRRCLSAGVLTLNLADGCAPGVYADGVEITGDLSAAEVSAVLAAAMARADALDAEALAARRAAVAAKVKGARPSGVPILANAKGCAGCGPVCECVACRCAPFRADPKRAGK